MFRQVERVAALWTIGEVTQHMYAAHNLFD